MTDTVHLSPDYYFRMNTPDCIEIAVRDPDINRQNPPIVAVDPPEAGGVNTQIEINGFDAQLLSEEGDLAVFYSTQNTVNRLDRDALSDHWRPANIPAGWTFDLEGAATVTAITRQTTFRRDEDVSVGLVGGGAGPSQFEHYIRFHLSAPLPVGTRVQISRGDGKFPSVDVVYNDKTTFCPGIHHNCYGRSPYLRSKHFTLSEILYGFGENANGLGSSEGIVDYLADGDKPFYIIRDDTKAIASPPYPITLRTSETDVLAIAGRVPNIINTPGNTWVGTGVFGDGAGKLATSSQASLRIDTGVTDNVVRVAAKLTTGASALGSASLSIMGDSSGQSNEIRLEFFGGAHRIVQRLNGTPTTLTTQSDPRSLNTEYDIRLESTPNITAGVDIKTYIDDVEQTGLTVEGYAPPEGISGKPYAIMFNIDATPKWDDFRCWIGETLIISDDFTGIGPSFAQTPGERASTTRHWPITEMPPANPLVITVEDTYLDMDLVVGDKCIVGYALGMLHANWYPGDNQTFYTITDITDNTDGTWDIEIGAKNASATVSMGGIWETEVAASTLVTGQTSGATGILSSTSPASGFAIRTFTSAAGGPFVQGENLLVEGSPVMLITTVPSYSAGFSTYLGEGHLYAIRKCNRAGTKVFQGDYSKWTPEQVGINYRVYIPGIGVGRTFIMDPGASGLLAKDFLGCIYDNTTGIAHTAYDRQMPRAFAGKPHYQALCTEQYGQEIAYNATYQTSVELPGFDHLYISKDAGDNDAYGGHMVAMQKMLRLQQIVSPEAWAADLGHPGALAVFAASGDTASVAFWAGTEDLPGIVQQTIVNFQGWRVMRYPDGEVSGGWCPINTGWLTYTGSVGAWVYKPDPQATWLWAAWAADLAVILHGEGLTTLAQTLVDLAEESYDRALEIIGNGTTDPDTYYADLIAVDSAGYTSRKANIINQSSRQRLQAALHLWRADVAGLTVSGATNFLSVVEAIGITAGRLFDRALYELTDDENKTQGSQVAAVLNGANYLAIESGAEYPNSSYNTPVFGTFFPSAGSNEFIGAFMVATGATKKAMQRANARVLDHMLGANAFNVSLCSQIGEVSEDWGTLENDDNRSNRKVFKGVAAFVYTAGITDTGFDWISGNFNYQSWMSASMLMYRNNFTGENATRMPEPFSAQLPIMENNYQNRSIIIMREHGGTGYAVERFICAMIDYDAGLKGNPPAQVGQYIRLGGG